MQLKWEEISQEILTKVDQDRKEYLKELRSEGPLKKPEMIFLFNLLNNLYDSFDPERFGCSKPDYTRIIDRLDALT